MLNLYIGTTQSISQYSQSCMICACAVMVTDFWLFFMTCESGLTPVTCPWALSHLESGQTPMSLLLYTQACIDQAALLQKACNLASCNALNNTAVGTRYASTLQQQHHCSQAACCWHALCVSIERLEMVKCIRLMCDSDSRMTDETSNQKLPCA